MTFLRENGLVQSWVRRRNARTREQVRTHRKIIRSGLDHENTRIVGLLETADFGVTADDFRGLVPEPYRHAALTCLRQLVMANSQSTLLTEVSKHVAGEDTAAVVPLPRVLRQHLARSGIKISAGLPPRFAVSLIERYCRALAAFHQFLRIAPLNSMMAHEQRGAHVLCKTRLQAIDSLTGERRADFAAWYRREAKLSSADVIIAEPYGATEIRRISSRVVVVPNHFPVLPPGARREFVREARRIVVSATFGLLSGRWWLPFLASQALELAYVRRIPAADLPSRYVFDSGDSFVRPLWTYAVEGSGSGVTVVLYSANFITFSPRADTPAAPWPGLSLMNWPNFIVPDEQSRQALLARGHAAEKIAISSSYIDLTDNGAALPHLSGRVLLVFDVPPYRTHFKAVRGFHNAYYTYEQWLRFMEDILHEGRRGNWTVAIKPKRGPHLQHDRRYDRYLRDLENRDRVVVLDPGITPSRAVSIGDAVVCMPFTSPAIAAGHEGKPAIYYDPGAQLRHCVELAHGLPLLFDSGALAAWLKSVTPQYAGATA